MQLPKIEAKALATGSYEVRVMNQDGTPVTPWTKPKKNLILPANHNGGNWISQMASAHAGTGSTPNSAAIDGTFSQAGTTVTRTTGTGVFISGNVGDYIKFATGERALITAFTNSVTVTVDRSQTVAAATVVIYDNSRTLLDTWVKGTTTRESGTEAITHSTDVGTALLTRTFNFTTEVSARSYTEVGISSTGSTSQVNLFSRMVLDTPVNVAIGQFLQLKYNLLLVVGNYRTRASLAVAPTGWPRPYNVVSITPGTAGGTAFDILLDEPCSSHYAVGRPIIVTGALPVKYNVTSYASTGSDFTVVTGTAHGRSPGDSIVIEGATPSSYNGTWTVATTPTSTTLTVTSAINPGAGTGGTVRQATPGTWFDGTWTIASFPTTSTIRVTSATVTVAAGSSGTVTNSTAATAIITGYGFGTAGAGGSNAILEMDFSPAVVLIDEANMKTSLSYGTQKFPTTTLGLGTLSNGTYDVANRKRTRSVSWASGAAISSTIRQLVFYVGASSAGQFYIDFDERQRKDNGYLLTFTITTSWEPDLS